MAPICAEGIHVDARVAFVRHAAFHGVAPKRDLRVARLFAPDLKAWGLNRDEFIETPKSTYGQTVLQAQAIHRARSDLDGLMWTSRQCDPDQCVILFEDRVGEEDFEIRDCIDVSGDATLLLELRAFGQRAGITIISQDLCLWPDRAGAISIPIQKF